MHTEHNESANLNTIAENSPQDKLLEVLAIIVLIGLFILGFYWLSLTVPPATAG